MDLGANFSARLEPYLLMGKSMKGAAAAKLIQDATSAPGVFVFGELLQLPNVQELGKNQEQEKHLSLLQLFAYKTYGDYLKHQDQLPPLNPAQVTKLKHLSIVTLAADKRILPYSELMTALQTPTIRELEDLIIDAIYLDILRGKLDQKEEQLEVEYTMGRDIEPEKLGDLLAALKDWCTTAAVLQTLDEKVASINTEANSAKARQESQEKEIQATLKELHEKSKEKGVSGSGGGGGHLLGGGPGPGGPPRGGRGYQDKMAMDVDEPEPPKGKNRKYVSKSFSFGATLVTDGDVYRAPQAEAKPQRKRNRM
ncbi:hypothetical protein AAF712_014694 [Marasmius tenuissimus]|uniref:PCI domain-containing protein n=1 Tax=Marasmius tenuissimus TaxID=585030 RepID=A0ABR2ZCW2_9AGAR